MANRLKIYACSGIGETEKQTYTYWTDNTNSVENTQAVNTLLVGINSLYTDYLYLENTKEEQLQLLNQIDLYAVCLEAAKRYNKHYKTLQKAGGVIGNMIKRGDFNYEELDESKRDAHLDWLIETAQDMWDGGLDVEETDPEFVAWWNDTIVARNKVGLDKEAQEKTISELRKAAKRIKGVGEADESWKENADISEYLTNAGTYFLYLFFTDDQFEKLPDVIKRKRQYQLRIYNYCKAYFVDIYGSEEDMMEIIRNGIKKDFHDTPENVCAAIANGKRIDKVGAITWTLSAIVGVIVAVASALVGIVYLICNTVYKSKIREYEAIDEAAIKAGCLDSTDYSKYDFPVIGKESNSKLWLIGAAAVAALLVIKD